MPMSALARSATSLEIDQAIFGDDVRDVGAWRDHDIALRKVEHNPAAALAALS
jgi:hypothetical protein